MSAILWHMPEHVPSKVIEKSDGGTRTIHVPPYGPEDWENHGPASQTQIPQGGQ